jgi:hypothetical protein
MPSKATISTGTPRLRMALSTCIHGVVSISSRAKLAETSARPSKKAALESPCRVMCQCSSGRVSSAHPAP